MRYVAVFAATLLIAGASTANSQDNASDYSPYLDRQHPDRVFWGDTHLHTSYSTDSGMLGNTLGPEEAYRFAKGEEVLSAAGLRARLIHPLDFLVVADHAENLGLLFTLSDGRDKYQRMRILARSHGVKPTCPDILPIIAPIQSIVLNLVPALLHNVTSGVVSWAVYKFLINLHML
jgi:hypothetical protein